jgi:hypothetical protein
MGLGKEFMVGVHRSRDQSAATDRISSNRDAKCDYLYGQRMIRPNGGLSLQLAQNSFVDRLRKPT